MSEPTFEYKCPNHGGNLNDMRKNWCDVTIITNGTKHLAHKIVLAANLKYFKTKLLSSPEDSKRDIIDMTGVDVTDLVPFVSYAYTGKILLKVDNAVVLLKDAHVLNEDGIKEACIKYLIENMKVNYACFSFVFASRIGSESLKDAAKLTIRKNLEVCLGYFNFLNVDYESLKIFLYDTKSSSKSQQVLFEGIVRWIIHDVPKRKDHTDFLLSLIDVSKLTAEYMMNYLGNVSHRNDLGGITQKILSCYRTSKFLKNKKRTILILQNFGEKLKFQQYGLIDKKWSPLQEIRSLCRASSASYGVILDDKLYYTLVNSCGVFSFDFTSSKIKIIRPFKTVETSAMCACPDFFYLCGSLDQIQKYDPHTDSVEMLECTERRNGDGSAAIFYENCIHILGGRSSSKDRILKSVIKYNAGTSKWIQFPSMCEERCDHAVTVLDGKLYACGGSDMNSVEVYEPATKGWRRVANMNKRRSDFLVVTYEGKLFAIGGDDEKTVEVYDPSKDEWQIDQEASSGLQIEHPRGGMVSDKCLQQRALKRLSEPTNEAPSDTSNNNQEV